MCEGFLNVIPEEVVVLLSNCCCIIVPCATFFSTS